VQPLPPTHFQADLAEENSVTLRWQPQPDPLEPTADATHYLVYTRRGDGGFDNGVLVDKPHITIGGLEPDVIYSYKVTAVNAGGESFPSETLAVCRVPQSRGTVLIVNGFDRVAPPAALEEGDMLGFAGFYDQGVPHRYDLNFTGAQFEFDASSDWKDDDAPGHGASYGDYETTVIAGNTFDFPYVHGLSVRAAGYSFVSASDEAIMAGTADPTRYPVLDLILGEEKTTPWPKPTRAPQFEAWPDALRQAIRRFTANGGRLFVSGAYVGTDLLNGVTEDNPAAAFARQVLHLHWRTDHAATTEGLIAVDTTLLQLPYTFNFNTTLGPTQYAVESPDAVEPADSSAITILRYAENNISAAIAAPSHQVIVFGFPFESITTRANRDAVMRAVLRWFE
ncbi:MAG: fibronectin type III domain-containing protein, partial [Acidiferrobacterales bacterium]|nr:fibronectin type III domain-containing protein [Acidiferrobacterales bacterium]